LLAETYWLFLGKLSALGISLYDFHFELEEDEDQGGSGQKSAIKISDAEAPSSKKQKMDHGRMEGGNSGTSQKKKTLIPNMFSLEVMVVILMLSSTNLLLGG